MRIIKDSKNEVTGSVETLSRLNQPKYDLTAEAFIRKDKPDPWTKGNCPVSSNEDKVNGTIDTYLGRCFVDSLSL